jgi:hypothetical protein
VGRRYSARSSARDNEPESTVAAIKKIGFDYFMIDNEHSLVGKESIYQYISSRGSMSFLSSCGRRTPTQVSARILTRESRG